MEDGEAVPASRPATQIARRPRLVRRWAQLVVGLVVIGTGICASVQARLGLAPWDVLHQGISRRTGVPLGTVGIVVGALLMVTWWPLRRRPGAGTVANVVIIGVTIDLLLPQTDPAHNLALRIALMALGVVLFAVGSGMYLGVQAEHQPLGEHAPGLFDAHVHLERGRPQRTRVDVERSRRRAIDGPARAGDAALVRLRDEADRRAGRPSWPQR